MDCKRSCGCKYNYSSGDYTVESLSQMKTVKVYIQCYIFKGVEHYMVLNQQLLPPL